VALVDAGQQECGASTLLSNNQWRDILNLGQMHFHQRCMACAPRVCHSVAAFPFFQAKSVVSCMNQVTKY
jgi:hypothetical protein